MAKLVLRPYANALFEIAKESGNVGLFEEEVRIVLETLEKEIEFMELLKHPKITAEEKIDLIDKIFAGKVADEITGILTIIVKKGRQDSLLPILELFLDMVSDHLGVVKATVTSAVELSKEQLAQVRSKIESGTSKTVELHAEVDKSLIGGMIIRVGDRVVDASISGRLQSLKDQLTNLRLA